MFQRRIRVLEVKILIYLHYGVWGRYKAWLHGNLIPRLLDHLGSRSILVGSPLHLTHDILNLSYPPMAISIGLHPIGKGGKIMLQHHNYGQI